VKNEDKIDESHKSQLKLEYEIYLLNYTIKIKTQKPTLCFCGFKGFLTTPKPRFLIPTSTALVSATSRRELRQRLIDTRCETLWTGQVLLMNVVRDFRPVWMRKEPFEHWL